MISFVWTDDEDELELELELACAELHGRDHLVQRTRMVTKGLSGQVGLMGTS